MKLFNLIIIFVISFIYAGCREKIPPAIASTYVPIPPAYKDIQLVPQKDTLNFHLDEYTYNIVRSFNYFKDHNKAYYAFYDRGSKTLNVFDFTTQRLVKRTHLEKWVNTSKPDKLSIYVKNFDSILVASRTKLYLFDSSGKSKNKLDFKSETEHALISNTMPPVFKGNMVYVGIPSAFISTTLEHQRKWRVLYGFDLKKDERQTYYPIPDVYHHNLFGRTFLEFSYCYNNNGKFVFSFAADPNIYESDLNNYHKAYNGKSKFQTESIPAVPEEALKKNQHRKQYALRDSYGTIFYDPYHKRYLRIARQKLSEAEFAANVKPKKSLIIFDEHFRIIGESILESGYSFDSLFFLENGYIYARVNTKDEHALHYVRMAYVENGNKLHEIAKK